MLSAYTELAARASRLCDLLDATPQNMLRARGREFRAFMETHGNSADRAQPDTKQATKARIGCLVNDRSRNGRRANRAQ